MARIAFIEVTATVSYGGVQTAVWKLAEAVATRGHAVTVFGGAGDIAPPPAQNLHVQTFPFTPRERIFDLGTRFRRTVERMSLARHARAAVVAGEFDWIIINKPADFFWPWILPRGSKTRVAFMSGGTDYVQFDRLLARRIDAMVCCSYFNAWQLRARYRRRNPVVIYNGVDVSQFAPHSGNGDERARLGLPRDATVFAFAGRLIGLKGVRVAVQALMEPELRDTAAHLLVIGDGPERARLQELARANGIAARVHFQDPVAHADLPNYYAAADVGVFPNIGDEAFGITIAEAMSCGKPVIGSYIGGIPEVIGNEGSAGLLVAPGNARELASAMRALALDPARRTRMGAAARRRIEENFTWHASAHRLLGALGL